MRNAQLLGVYPPASCVKIGDTVSDIEEGKNAGMWTIGLTRTGNLIGLDAASWDQLSESEQQARLKKAEEIMRNVERTLSLKTFNECDSILAQIGC